MMFNSFSVFLSRKFSDGRPQPAVSQFPLTLLKVQGQCDQDISEVTTIICHLK